MGTLSVTASSDKKFTCSSISFGQLRFVRLFYNTVCMKKCWGKGVQFMIKYLCQLNHHATLMRQACTEIEEQSQFFGHYLRQCMIICKCFCFLFSFERISNVEFSNHFVDKVLVNCLIFVNIHIFFGFHARDNIL